MSSYLSIGTLAIRDYRLPFFRVSLRGSPFSTSSDEDRNIVSLLANLLGRPWRDGPGRPLTESGNSVRRGVSAAATLRADRRIVSRTLHSRFFAMKNKVAVETWGGCVSKHLKVTEKKTRSLAYRR